MLTESEIQETLFSMHIKCSPGELEQMMRFLELITKQNTRANITGTKEKEKILNRHFFDCLSAYSYFIDGQKNKRVTRTLLDVGSGGGLPGILLSIFIKDYSVYLLDSRKKATDFLEETIKILGLGNTLVISGRAEEIAHDPGYREKFDLVTARAVSKTIILAELSLPFCKIGGKVMFYKSRKSLEEIKEAEDTINILGGKIENIYEISTPFLKEYRALIVLKKVSSSLYKYPRKYAKMIKTPLIVHKSF